MNGPEHKAIVQLAYECLPGQPPGIKGFLEETISTCMLPDQLAIALLKGESDESWRHYFPPKLPPFNFQLKQGDFRAMLPDSRFYASRILALLRQNELREAARYLGVYSHYLGDFSQPAHHYELHIGRLLPPPPHMRNCEYHRMIEDIPSSVPPLQHHPQLLGETLGEMLFRMEGRFAELYDLSVASVVPMVNAIYSRRFEAASVVLNRVVEATAKLFADFCFTAEALACREFPQEQVRRLKVCDLRKIPPHDYDAEFNFGHRPLIDCITIERWGKAQPFALKLNEQGELTIKKAPGLCVIPHALPIPGVQMRSMMEFHLPAKTFRRFECLFGLLADSRPQAACNFIVETDGTTAYKSTLMKPSSPAIPISIDIAGCRRLRLIAETDGSTDRLAFPIWARPKLVK